MSNRSAMKADALVLDAQPTNRQQVRTALLDWGFSTVKCVSSTGEFKKSLRRPNWSLIVADAFADGDEACQLVRRIRQGELYHNPFVFIILTSWRAESEALNLLIDTGADDVVLRPFAQGDFLDRIARLSSRDRRFVASADYIGPDRRRDDGRESECPIFPTPNLGQVIARTADMDVAHLRTQVGETHKMLLSEQIRWLAMRVATTAHVGVRLGALPSIRREELLDAARRYKKLLKGVGAPRKCVTSANQLFKVAHQLENSDTLDKRLLNLAAEYAATAYAEFAGDGQLTAALSQAQKQAERILARSSERKRADAQLMETLDDIAQQDTADVADTLDLSPPASAGASTNLPHQGLGARAAMG